MKLAISTGFVHHGRFEEAQTNLRDDTQICCHVIETLAEASICLHGCLKSGEISPEWFGIRIRRNPWYPFGSKELQNDIAKEVEDRWNHEGQI